MIATESEALEARSAAAGEAVKRSYVRRMFSDIAPRYDFLNQVLSFGLHRSWRRAALAELGWERKPAGTYLDLCAGTLDVAVSLAATPGFTGRVIGADFAEPMLREGRGKVRGTAVSPLVGDAAALPFGDATCDGAIVAFGIRNVERLDQALSEVHRVLAPRARFVILEFSTPSVPVFRAGYNAYFHHVLPVVGRVLSGHPTAYSYLPHSVEGFPDTRALCTHMSTAGFERVEWRSRMFGVVAIHVGVKGTA